MQSFNSMIYSNYNVAHAHQIYNWLDALWLRELVFISIGFDSILSRNHFPLNNNF